MREMGLLCLKILSYFGDTTPGKALQELIEL